MFYFVFVSLLLSNAIWSYSKAAASMTSISQKANSSKWLRWSSFLEDLGCVAILPLRNVFFFFFLTIHAVKAILRFCLDFGNKNTKILLQLSDKRLITSVIHNFSFTAHKYRPSALQIHSWYSISGVFLTVLHQDSKFCRRK